MGPILLKKTQRLIFLLKLNLILQFTHTADADINKLFLRQTAVNTNDVDFEETIELLILSLTEKLFSRRRMIVSKLKDIDAPISWKLLFNAFEMREIFADIEDDKTRNFVYNLYLETMKIENRIFELKGIK